ncbi:PEGA domain-containing protein [bacterium]|nr:PEGA domain-containing protein [bacterium]
MKYLLLLTLFVFMFQLFADEDFAVMLQVRGKEKIPQDFRDGFEQALTERGYSLVDEIVQNDVMKEQTDYIDGCIDDACLITTGKMLATRGVVVVEVVKKEENVYSFKAKYLDFETGTNKKTYVEFYKYSLNDYERLIEFGKDMASKMFDRINSLKNREFYKIEMLSDKPETIVFLNGKNLGKAPVKMELPEGKYGVKMTKEGHHDFTQEVSLIKNMIVKGEMKEKFYNIEIKSNVISNVLINGEEVGVTPYIAKLKASEYKITLKSDGYHSSEKIINVFKNESIDISLEIISCDLLVKSNQKDVVISIENEIKGVAPLKLSLEKREYTIEAVWNDTVQKKAIQACKDSSLSFEFKKPIVKKEEIKTPLKEKDKSDEKNSDLNENKSEKIVESPKIKKSNNFSFFELEIDAIYRYLAFDNVETSNVFTIKGYLTLLLYKFGDFKFSLGGVGYGVGTSEYTEFSFHALGVKYYIGDIELSGDISFLFGRYFIVANSKNGVMSYGGVKISYLKKFVDFFGIKPYISMNYGLSANKYETESDDKTGFIFGVGFSLDLEL